jgi:microcystin-dependent protein
MSDPFIAEIRIFPFNFAPRGWAACNGQLMPLAQNTALFSLVGTTYGGNGISNFALPNLAGRLPLAPGQGPGLSMRDLGAAGGSATVALQASQMPAHSHQLAASASATSATPAGNVMAPALTATNATVPVYKNGSNRVAMAPTAVAPVGAGLPHNNLPPYLALNFCIALQGVYPPRG